MKEMISRRGFLKQGAALAALTATGLVAAREATGKEGVKQPDAMSNSTVLFDEVFDVIVIGSGLAGTAAAIGAAEKGDNVIVLEKMATLGGNSLLSDFNFACAGSDEQVAQGIKDTTELMAADMRRLASDYGNPDLALEVAKGSVRFYQLLKKRGVKFELLKGGKGHSVARVLWMPEGGKKIMAALHSYVQTSLAENCQVRKEVRVEAVVTDKGGRAIGVRAADDQAVKLYGARKGVVFATGGYAYDKAYLQGEAPILAHLSERTPLVSRGATADSLKLLISTGAHPVNTALYYLAYPVDAGDLGWGLIVDREGKRVVNEMADRNTIGRMAFKAAAKSEGQAPIIIYDQTGINNFRDKQRLEAAVQAGLIKQFATVEAVASAYGLPFDELKKTIDVYHAAIDAGEDKAFKKKVRDLKGAAMKQAPFYAMEVVPGFNYTPGGVKIDAAARVLRIKDGKAIEGLFAAGEATGGIHGAERLTGCAVADCGAFGLIAADSVHAMSPVSLSRKG